MALKLKHATKAEVPAEQAALYVERDGAWHLDVEGAVEKAKLEEFRATNVALLKEREELRARFAGIDPDEVRKLAEAKRQLEEQQQLKAGEFEKVLESRIKTMKAELEKQLAGVAMEPDSLSARLDQSQNARPKGGPASPRDSGHPLSLGFSAAKSCSALSAVQRAGSARWLA